MGSSVLFTPFSLLELRENIAVKEITRVKSNAAGQFPKSSDY